MSRKVKLLLILFLSLPELIGLGVWAVDCYREHQRETATSSNLHAIEIALTKFRDDDPNGSFPFELESPRMQELLPDFPRNPYTARSMHLIRPGDKPVAGDFCYLVERVDAPPDHPDWPGYPIVQRYILVAYGPRVTKRFTRPLGDFAGAELVDWSRVIVELQSGWEYRYPE